MKNTKLTKYALSQIIVFGIMVTVLVAVFIGAIVGIAINKDSDTALLGGGDSKEGPVTPEEIIPGEGQGNGNQSGTDGDYIWGTAA